MESVKKYYLQIFYKKYALNGDLPGKQKGTNGDLRRNWLYMNGDLRYTICREVILYG